MSIALRPMNTGELLDRTFNLYRNNLILFAGIALLPPLLKLGLDAVQLASLRGPIMVAGRFARTSNMNGSYFLLLLVYLLGFIFASGATVYAVSMVHLGKPASISESYKAIGPHFLRLIGVFLLIFLAMMGLGIVIVIPLFAVSTASPGLVLFGMVIGGLVLVHLYACLSLATPVCVVEKSRVRNSLRRSMALTRGARGKIWLVFILFAALELALYVAVAIPVGIIAVKTGSIFLSAMLFATAQFLVSVFVTPVLTVSLVLIYYDQRVRKEAFDLHLMMQSLGETATGQAATATPIG